MSVLRYAKPNPSVSFQSSGRVFLALTDLDSIRSPRVPIVRNELNRRVPPPHPHSISQPVDSALLTLPSVVGGHDIVQAKRRSASSSVQPLVQAASDASAISFLEVYEPAVTRLKLHFRNGDLRTRR